MTIHYYCNHAENSSVFSNEHNDYRACQTWFKWSLETCLNHAIEVALSQS